MNNLIKERNPIYSSADITVESKSNITQSEMVDQIVEKLKKNNMLNELNQKWKIVKKWKLSQPNIMGLPTK